MEKLLQYFMQETDKKFDSIGSDLRGVNAKLDDLTKFKVEMLATARTTSLIVSVLSGLVTLSVSVWAAMQVVRR